MQKFFLLLVITIAFTQFPTASAQDGEKPIVAMDADEDLSLSLIEAYEQLGSDYEPRTEHLLADGRPKYVNRLVNEDSPYLLQHAHNPVNWYPWGEEAFAVAKSQNKPVFLSIGYATCHWCHVMERESFENEAIADLMNEHYISVKVDREQLPDVDALFMSAVMMINGSGGWPMSSFLDTDGRSFYGATYFPPDRFTQILERINQLWQDEPDTLLEQATQVTTAIARLNDTSSEATEVGLREIERAITNAQESFDPDNGGFGAAPKFPREPTLYFLLDQATRTFSESIAAEAALLMADLSLKHMAAGGIHDHVGGGFHRYAVDSRWLVPHFEKMLYNQAALARNYSQAYKLTGDAQHGRTARRTLDYVLRDMTGEAGMFYSATDADSEGEEGVFFIWTPEELAEILGDEDAALASLVWNVTGEGNFEGTSILHTPRNLAEIARGEELSLDALEKKVETWSDALRIAREEREHPIRDEKFISSWNGMMISALAESADRLDQPDYLDAAVKAADAVWNNLRQTDGSLYRAAFDGKASIDGTQADYAYLAEGYLAVYDATGDRLWLDRAEQLISTMNEKFWDDKNGAYFMGAQVVSGAGLSSRPKDLNDNSIPSGNSVALRVLSRLFKRTGEPNYEARTNELIAALSGRLSQQPAGFYYLLTGIAEHLQGEAGNLQYGGRGVARAQAFKRDGKLVVAIDLDDNWHINSDKPLQDYLIATALTDANGNALKNVQFPDAHVRKLGFQRSELSLFENKIEIQADWPDSEHELAVLVNLQLQACDDEVCLAPETLPLTIF